METYVVKKVKHRTANSEGEVSLARTIKNISGVDSYTPIPTDVNCVVELNYASTLQVKVDDVALADMEIGEYIVFVKEGIGDIEFIVPSGADTVLLSADGAVKIAKRYGWVFLLKKSETHFYLEGRLTT